MLRKAMMVTAVIVCLGCLVVNRSLKAKGWPRSDEGKLQLGLNLAQQKYENNCFDEAKRAVSECVIADPDLDLATQGPEQTKQMLFDGNKALSLNPTKVDHVLAVAEMYVKQEKLEDAIKLLEEKMAAMPREIALKTAVTDFMLAGENERAIELYEQAMLMRGDDSSIAEALGYCYVFSGRWSEGAKIFNKLVEQCQDEQKKKLYLIAAALCGMNSPRSDRAVNSNDELIPPLQQGSGLSVKERDSAENWVKMGQAALSAGEARKAFMCGEKALVLQPGDANAIALEGCAQYLMGQYYEAIRSFEKITSDERNGGISWLMRARCYEQLGQKDKAGQAYKKALEIEPHSELGDFLAKRKNVEDLGFTTED
jgi:tetratricopeptide (TPR) repeat protein